MVADNAPAGKEPSKKFQQSALKTLAWMRRRWAYSRERKGYKQFSPFQEAMADALGLTVRQIRKHLAWLEKIGTIRRRRGLRGNSYIFLDQPAGTEFRCGEELSSDAERNSVPMGGGTEFRCGEELSSDACNRAEAGKEEKQKKELQQQGRQQQPSLFARTEKRDAFVFLTDLGLGPRLAKKWADQDAELCIAVAVWAAERFKKKRPRNPAGYVHAALKDPAKYCIERLPGGDYLGPPETGCEPADLADLAEASGSEVAPTNPMLQVLWDVSTPEDRRNAVKRALQQIPTTTSRAGILSQAVIELRGIGQSRFAHTATMGSPGGKPT